METSVFQIVMAVLFVAVCAYTIIGYPKQYGALTPRSRLFRTLGIVLLDLLIGLALLYTIVDVRAGVPANVGVIRVLLYLGSCIFLAFALFCIAMLDALETVSSFRREKRQNVELFLREEVERLQQHKQETMQTATPQGGGE